MDKQKTYPQFVQRLKIGGRISPRTEVQNAPTKDMTRPRFGMRTARATAKKKRGSDINSTIIILPRQSHHFVS